MKTLWRDPQVEEGIHNIILQNRCGNRLTLLVGEGASDLELVYKPSALRRKEYAARNFSNRDNFTTLFASLALPEIGAAMVKAFDYDPFVTRLRTESASAARNLITIVNVADENCFAVAARCPLVLALRPHKAFDVGDGLITESFADRGEAIVSFVRFAGLETNRYRVLEDGTHILQIFENEVVLIGGEETIQQVHRLCRRLDGMDLEALIVHTERAIAAALGRGRLTFAGDADLQRVVDINKRLVWSGLDAGGACFGAMNRIYHLIWTRDGAMAASTLARAGMTDPIGIWTPFLLANPAVRRDDEGRLVREFLQIVGSRWTKTEDDGIYYAMLSLFSLVHTTGDDALVAAGALADLLDILDRTIDSRFDPAEGLFGSDTLGEDLLASSPYYGYDTVNGKMVASHHRTAEPGRVISRAYSLYQNVNMYNCLRMAQVLIGWSGDARLAARVERCGELAGRIAATLAERFVNEKGHYRAMLVVYADGSRQWTEFAPRSDYWEYAWAVSAGPFLPDPIVSLRSARMAVEVWPTLRTYGYCPWNFLARSLKEYGLSSAAYRKLLEQQISEALMVTRRYPMQGLVTEYQGAVEQWRGLPFQTGSLTLSASGLLLQALPLGLAARASDLLDRIDGFVYRSARIDVAACGAGDVVGEVSLNGQRIVGTLQIPDSLLRMGPNELRITRAGAFDGPRLHGSDATLVAAAQVDGRVRLELESPLEQAQLMFENWPAAIDVRAHDAPGAALAVAAEPVPQSRCTLVRLGVRGRFFVEFGRK